MLVDKSLPPRHQLIQLIRKNNPLTLDLPLEDESKFNIEIISNVDGSFNTFTRVSSLGDAPTAGSTTWNYNRINELQDTQNSDIIPKFTIDEELTFDLKTNVILRNDLQRLLICNIGDVDFLPVIPSIVDGVNVNGSVLVSSRPDSITVNGGNELTVMITWTEPGDAGGPTYDTMSYRDGTPLQGELTHIGKGLSSEIHPIPDDYAFYRFDKNYVENKENFVSIFPMPDSDPPVVNREIKSVELSSVSEQYLKVPPDDQGGFDILGMLGKLGTDFWYFGLQFKLDMLPPTGETVCLFNTYYGEYGLSLEVDPTGSIIFTWNGQFKSVISIDQVVQVGKWSGVWVKHSNESGYNLSMGIPDGTIVTDQNPTPPYFNVGLDNLDPHIYLGRGNVYTETSLDPSILPFTLGSGLVLSNGSELTNSTNQFLTAHSNILIDVNTGVYYIEFDVIDGYDAHFGVVPVGVSISDTTGRLGWAHSMFAGRKFAQQTGGGTNYGSPIPVGSTVGVVYDSVNGQLEYFVNGVSRGKPFSVGTINETVVFSISGRGMVNTGSLFHVKIKYISNTWTYAPAIDNLKDLSGAVTKELTGHTYLDGSLRHFFYRKEEYLIPRIGTNLITPDLNKDIIVIWENISTSESHIVNNSILKSSDTTLIQHVPDLPPGNYNVYFKDLELSSIKRKFAITEFKSRITPLHVDFANVSRGQLSDDFIIAHKQWGGLNGGVISENVIFDESAGLLKVRGCGDLYTGPLRGVDAFGVRNDTSTRIGGCVVTRDYFGPASYRTVARLPLKTGVVSAFWTFHYEEGYPGTSVYDSHIADGIRRAGNEENGYYTVRNHEIDIEIPTALKADPNHEVVSYRNGRYNTWFGENRNWDVTEGDPDYWTEYEDDWLDHGSELNDGEFHEFRFDWHLGTDPRVEYYIDGVLLHTIRKVVPDIPGRYWAGLWFPSSPTNHWAGKLAEFSEEWMDIKSMTILPFVDEDIDARQIGETYPRDVFKEMFP